MQIFYGQKQNKDEKDEIKKDISEFNLLKMGTTFNHFKLIKLARKNILYWKILKFKTKNFLNPISIKLKIRIE